MRILIIEDDRLLGEALRTGLGQASFQADWVQDGEQGWAALRAEPFAAAVLDLGLPKLGGIELLRRLRSSGSTLPVLILTARDTAQDTVAGLDAGADDYMTKPFDFAELGARLRALIRRAAGNAAPLLQHGALTLDPASRAVTYEGRAIELSLREFTLLHELLLNAGKVMTRMQLEARLYAWGDEIESNALEVHIHHLRRKLAPELIRTLRGVGYMIPR